MDASKKGQKGAAEALGKDLAKLDLSDPSNSSPISIPGLDGTSKKFSSSSSHSPGRRENRNPPKRSSYSKESTEPIMTQPRRSSSRDFSSHSPRGNSYLSQSPHARGSPAHPQKRPSKQDIASEKRDRIDEDGWQTVHHGHHTNTHHAPTAEREKDHHFNPRNSYEKSHGGSHGATRYGSYKEGGERWRGGRGGAHEHEGGHGKSHVGSYDGHRHGRNSFDYHMGSQHHEGSPRDHRMHLSAHRGHPRDVSPSANPRERAFATCRRAIVEGDNTEVVREVLVSKQIGSANDFGFFGHAGSDGQTLLMVACKYGRLGIIRMLLEDFNAEVNFVGGLGHFTALHYAAWHGHIEVVRYLLSRGADWRVRNGDGETPEQSALAHGNKEIAQCIHSWAEDPKCDIKELDKNEEQRAHDDAAKARDEAMKSRASLDHSSDHSPRGRKPGPAISVAPDEHVTVTVGFAPS
eukprot:comp19720_c2_seq1/m.23478 comp19720_c2_seq1/g.23478  ORF comp19720_c2_seq1/g.23478 comp19720_c2_seq1/m.23478 type:complete len:463 (-) comp19720_c2_seq1:26-1414(-)